MTIECRDKEGQRIGHSTKKNNSNLFAQAGFIIPAGLQGQGENIAYPAAVSDVPTQKEYDEIEIDTDDFYGDDDDDDADIGDFDDAAESYCPVDTLMGQYITALKREISKELQQTAEMPPKWLMQHLETNGFVVRAESAPSMCSKLQVNYTWQDKEYYRDVHFWLPDVQHKILPPCPNGCGTKDIGNHGFDYDHPGRRITTTDSCYYLVTRRYVCHECKKKKWMKTSILFKAGIGSR